jgi:uncharacterized repeat protein (TIGR01451 family)
LYNKPLITKPPTLENNNKKKDGDTMSTKTLYKRIHTPKINRPVIYTTAMLLITLCFTPFASSCPQLGIQVIITGPIFDYAGEEITYTYHVSNTGSKALNNVGVTDDQYSPVNYVSGDENHNNKLDTNELWIFSCTYTPDFTFPDPLINIATAQGTWEAQTVQDTDRYSLDAFILRKNVLLYWEGQNIEYNDPETQFTITMSKNDATLDTFAISESTTINLWLSKGTYQFTEINIPNGYLSAYQTITFTTCETYPDFSQLNIITFDLRIEKTGPETCYPNDQITYQYIVQNSGPASISPSLLDDRCGTPVYTGGDSDSDGLIDPSETWTYNATTIINAEPGSIIMNTVTVTDEEGADHAPEQWWLGGDVNLSNNVANWSVAVISQPDEPEEPQNPDEPDEPQNPDEPDEPDVPDEPIQPTITTRHSSTYHFGDISPIANASGPYYGSINEDITFDGSKSYDADGFILHSSWSFGDGETGVGETVTHHYTHSGIYPVTLTVTDNLGVSDTDVTNATIVEPNRPPTNPLIAGPMNGTKNTEYSYAFRSTDADNDDITYLINWGDGSTSETEFLPNAQYFSRLHHWDLQGDYTIKVTASDGTSASSSEMVVTIHDTLVVDNIAIIALGILALIALIAALLYSKKKKKSE